MKKRTLFYSILVCAVTLVACKKSGISNDPCGIENLEKGIMINNTGMSCCGYMFQSSENGKLYEIDNIDNYPELKEKDRLVYIAYKQSAREASCCMMGDNIIEITCYALEDSKSKAKQ